MLSYSTYAQSLRTAPLDNGLQYWEAGEGPVLIFLHGALSNGYTWRKVLPALSQSFRCIALHLPLGAHRIALSTSVDLSPKGIAGLLHDFVAYKKIDSFTLVANDTGGAYAQVYASLYPKAINGMILSNCEVQDVFPPPAFVYMRYAVRIPFFTFLMSKLFQTSSLLKHSSVLGKLSIQATSKELAEGYVQSFVKDVQIRKNFRRAARYWHPSYTIEAAEKLKNFSAPILILWGDQDTQLFPKPVGQKLLNIFPHAQWQDIENARTYIQEDAPEQVVKFIKIFIQDLQKQ
jgi:pimeloyl-ACP methyl ester carboxylesterase